MDSYRHIFSVVKMAQRLGVSVSSYYDFRRCRWPSRVRQRAQRETLIKTCFDQAEERYGSIRVAAELKAQGTPISRTTVAKYMRRMGLRSKLARKYRVTTDSKHNNLVAENLLDRRFTVDGPGKVWVSDITYLRRIGGWEYLTTVIDLWDRKVIGWSNSTDLKAANTVIPAFEMAIRRRSLEHSGISARGPIFHSDRGVQYTCKEFVGMLEKHGFLRSNSGKGDCWDNAVAESFFKTLKAELIYGQKLVNTQELRTQVFEWIECWYNKKRRHSALNNLTIDEFWKRIPKPKNHLNNMSQLNIQF